MRFVIQRVTESEVKVDGETLGKIGKGFMVLQRMKPVLEAL